MATMVEDYNAESDIELVRLSRRGDKGAFEALFHRYYKIVASIGYRYTGDIASAEDVAQETFLKVWTHLGDFQQRHSGGFRAWLARIARSSAIDAVRKRKPSLSLDETWLNDDDPSLESKVEERERAEDVQYAIMKLPERSREVLILREYGELSYAEIADVLGIPIGTVMSRLNYARKALKRELKEYLEIG